MMRPSTILLLLLWAFTTKAQTPLTEEPEFLRFGCGDIDVRCGAVMSKISVEVRAVYLIPDAGWTADLFLVRHDFEKGWINRVNEWGYNAFAYSAVGTGHADAPPTDDLKILSEQNVYQPTPRTTGTRPDHVVGKGMSRFSCARRW